MTSPRSGRLLSRSFYNRPTLDVASALLGKMVVRRAPEGLAAGMIVEAEAYVGESDPACHAASGLTRRNEPMYGNPGHAYVYFSYGVHHLLNVVTEGRGFPAAVLIRALEPVDGLDLMRRRRAPGRGRLTGGRRGGSVPRDADLCRGPGNLTRALGITLAENRADLTRSASKGGAGLWIEDRGLEIDEVGWTPRIGIRLGADLAWRCFVRGSPSVSGRRSPRN